MKKTLYFQLYNELNPLVIFSGDNEEVDKFTSKNFEDEQSLRQKHQKQIRDYLKKIYSNPNIDTIGTFVIKYENANQTHKILFKKDIDIFKTITRNRKFVEKTRQEDYFKNKLGPDFFDNQNSIFGYDLTGKMHRSTSNPSRYDDLITEWLRRIKKQPHYHEVIRNVLIKYQNFYKSLDLKSPDEIYQDILNEKKKDSYEEELIEENIDRQKTTFDENGWVNGWSVEDMDNFPPNTKERTEYLTYLDNLPNEYEPHIDNFTEKITPIIEQDDSQLSLFDFNYEQDTGTSKKK